MTVCNAVGGNDGNTGGTDIQPGWGATSDCYLDSTHLAQLHTGRWCFQQCVFETRVTGPQGVVRTLPYLEAACIAAPVGPGEQLLHGD